MRSLSCLAIVCALVNVVAGADNYRNWTDTNGNTLNARIYKPPTSDVLLQEGNKTAVHVAYGVLCNEDLGYIAGRYPKTERHIVPVVMGRITSSIESVDIEKLADIRKTMPFMEPHISTQLRGKLESGSRDYETKELVLLVTMFSGVRDLVEETITERLVDPANEFTFKELNGISTAFPKLRPRVVANLREMLNNSSESFFAQGARNSILDGMGKGGMKPYDHEKTGAVPHIKRWNAEQLDSQYREIMEQEQFRASGDHRMQMQLDAFEQLCRSFPELKPDVGRVLAKELLNSVNNERLKNLVVLDKIRQSFPDPQVEKAIKTVLIRMIRNPLEHDGQRIDVNRRPQAEYQGQEAITGGRRSHQSDTFLVEGPWFYGDAHVTVTKFFDHDRLALIVRVFPDLRREVEQAMSDELDNPVNRWSRFELREIATSYPGIKSAVEGVYRREVANPTVPWAIDELIWVSSAYPGLRSDIEVGILRIVKAPRAEPYSYETLVKLARNYERLQKPIEGLLKAQLANPVFARTFSDPEQISSLLTDFPALKTEAEGLVLRYLRSDRSGQGGAIFSLPKLEECLAKYPALYGVVEALVQRELQNPMVQWQSRELDSFSKHFPNLTEDIANVIRKDLENPAKKFTLPELQNLVARHPNIREDAVACLKRIIQNPQNRYGLPELVECALAFEEVKDIVVSRAKPLIEERAQQADIKDMDLLIQEYPLLTECIRDIERRNFPAIAERSDLEALQQWMIDTDNTAPEDEKIREILIAKGHEFPVVEMTIQEKMEAKGKEIGFYVLRQYWPYIAGWASIVSVLFLLLLFKQPRWLWAYMLGLALIVPAPIVLLILFSKYRAWRKRKRQEHEEYLASGGKTLKEKIAAKATATKEAAQKKASVAAEAVSRGARAAKQRTAQAGSAVASATSQATAAARDKAKELKTKAEDIARQNLATGESPENPASLTSNPDLPSTVVHTAEEARKSSRGGKERRGEPSSTEAESASGRSA